MPIKKSAIKALRQNLKRARRNVKVRKTIKDLVKKSEKMIGLKEPSALDKVKAAIKSVDKAVGKKVFKRNTGARLKSKLMKKLNALGK